MKLKGGFLPKIAGRPTSVVEDIPIPDKLFVSLNRKGVNYLPVVKNGSGIKQGEPLAEAAFDGGKLYLTSPAAGKVTLDKKEEQAVGIILETKETSEVTETGDKFKP